MLPALRFALDALDLLPQGFECVEITAHPTFDGERVMFKWKDYRAKLDLKESLVAGNRDGEKCRSLATAPRMGCASSGGGGCRLVLRVSQLPQSPPAIRHP